MNAMDRDAISGWGAVVHVIEKDKVRVGKEKRTTVKMLKEIMKGKH